MCNPHPTPRALPLAGGRSPCDSGSQKVQHYLDTISHRCGYRELMLDGPPENSSDSERAGPARSIADEFSGGPSILSKLRRCEVKRFSHSRCTFWDPESNISITRGFRTINSSDLERAPGARSIRKCQYIDLERCNY